VVNVGPEIAVAKTAALKPHPLNEKLYGKMQVSRDFEELRDSIRENGILVPLLVTPDNTIVSGHRRWFFAKQQHIDEIPIQRVETKEPAEIEALIIHTNRQRVKTTEQEAREFKHLKRLAEAKAAKRTGGRPGKEEKPKENFPEVSGQARDIAAAAVGMSGRTAEKAATVVDAIDAMEAEGKAEDAEKLRATLNRSVDGAYKEIRPSQPAAPKPEPKPQPEPEPIQCDSSFLVGKELEQFKALTALWDAAGQYVRAAFLEYIDKAEAA
jgi:ParB-like chromosome segregation protein Spo0J